MIKNYLKIAYRLFKKHKGYSLINVAGLAVGMACCILILLWVQDELSYDRYHENTERVYRITYAEEIGGAYNHYTLSPFVATAVFHEEVPEIEAYTRLWKWNGLIKYGQRKFEADNLYYVDESFFKLFTHPFLQGHPDKALQEPGCIVLTESMAKKIFGSQNPLGETVHMNIAGDLKVTAVVKDVPENSHFRFNYLVSMKTLPERPARYLTNWFVILGWNYVLLKDGADPTEVEKKINAAAQRHSGKEAKKYGQEMEYFLQRLTDIHLRSHLEEEIEAQGSIFYVYVFSVVALFILVIACINFMNLSTARSANRSREVGIRKVFGARKKLLVNQFITESVLLAFLGLLLAVMLVWLFLPMFNTLTGKGLDMASLNHPVVWLGFLGLIAVTGGLAGFYPAFVLSSFQPVQVLGSCVVRGSRRSGLRNGLVTFQFVVSIILIISTFIVMRQVSYMKNRALGFNKNQVLIVPIKGEGFRGGFKAFKTAIQRHHAIQEASYSSGIPGRTDTILTTFQEGKDESVNHVLHYILADYDFVKTYEIPLAEGRDFSREYSSDASGAYLINETAAAKLGWGEETIGKKIGYSPKKMAPIVGITKDFHYRSLHEVIAPLAICLREREEDFLSIRMKTNNISETISFLGNKWREFEKDREFSWFFLDESFDRLYRSEERLSRIVSIFAFLAIFVACLGLFGLASYTVQQGTREIGVRKVLGATVQNIVIQLSLNFLRWVVLANIIAWPITYYVMKTYWLQNFPFRVNIGLLTFIYAGVLSLVIALLTVSYQSFKAALANPVDSLRTV
jgi:putative ABC transport system permease protein